MTCHRFVFWLVVFIASTVQISKVQGSLAATEYVLVIISTNSSGYIYHYGECEAKGAHFGRDIKGDDTIAGCTIPAWPIDACDPITPAPSPFRNGSTIAPLECVGGFFAVAARGNCSFAQKAFQAQASGYNGIIVYNTDNSLLEMATDADYGPRVIIPAFMVGHDCGLALIEKYSYENSYAFYIRANWSYQELIRYLIPFVAVIGACFLIMVAAMVVKLVRDRRRRNRWRLSKKHLKKIPTRKFAAGDDPETCPICLDDFVIGDKLRILPCDHTYHSACIDPWLLKNRRVCPICKRKVLPKESDPSHDGSDTDESTNGGAAGPSRALSTPERTPLLSHDERSVVVGNSTFYGLHVSYDDASANNVVTFNSPAGSPMGSGRRIVLSGPPTPDGRSTPDDPTIDVDNRKSLLPQMSLYSSTDSTQPGFVTAASSFREGCANPNFVSDSQEFDSESVAVSSASGGHSTRNDVV